MKRIANLLTSIALLAAAPCAKAQAQGNEQPALPSQTPVKADAAKHALCYGKRCIIKRGFLIAVSEQALRRLYHASRVHDTDAIVRLVTKHQVENTIRDALAIPVSPHGFAYDVVEVHIPGFFGNVFTPRVCLDGDVQGYLAAH
jgi:hypothetical protein